MAKVQNKLHAVIEKNEPSTQSAFNRLITVFTIVTFTQMNGLYVYYTYSIQNVLTIYGMYTCMHVLFQQYKI